jgi:SET domain-containing protein
LSMRPSRVHRFGVFSEEPISAGEKVIEYTGERVSRSEAVRRCRKGLTYLYMLDSYRSIDGSAGGSGAELINHCREPNCRFHKEDGRVWIVRVRPIPAGEELLLDYKFRKTYEMAPCYCGAPTCRGTINVRSVRSTASPQTERYASAAAGCGSHPRADRPGPANPVQGNSIRWGHQTGACSKR